MKYSIVFIGLLLYFVINFADARKGRHSKPHAKNEKFTEVDDEQEVDLTTRLLASIPTTEELDESLKSDMKAIQSFAQSVRPMAKNIRRSMHSRRGLNQELAVISNFVKDIMINMIDASDKFIPHLKPLTKYLRLFVTKIFGK